MPEPNRQDRSLERISHHRAASRSLAQTEGMANLTIPIVAAVMTAVVVFGGRAIPKGENQV